MIELEIQALSERREGLLMEVGRLVLASGFSLQRQRLVQDPHGILLTMVVRGPPRKKRALAAALDAHERIISFELEPVTEGEERAHFAASRAPSAYVPPVLPVAPPAPEAAPPTAPTRPAAATAPAVPAFDEVAPVRLVTPTAAPAPPPAVAARPTPEPDLEFILPPPAPAPVAPAPAVVAEAPFVELVPLEPDQEAIDKLLPKLATEYPQIMPRLQQLDRAVAEAAREPTLALAGRRTGAWLAQREPTAGGRLDLEQAIAQRGVPALRALVEVEQDGSQLHIRHSPLCGEPGHSGCIFFSGFLEGLLAPVLDRRELSIFAVCCRSYGADDCVLALPD